MSVVESEIPQACAPGCKHEGASWREYVGYVVFLGFRDGATKDVAYVTGEGMREHALEIVKDECAKANAGAYENLREVYVTGAALGSDGKLHTWSQRVR
jgi:hypothetical protein